MGRGNGEVPRHLRARVMHGELVPVEALRERFRQSDMSAGEMCRQLGWYTKKPDTQRFLRAVGLYPGQSHGSTYYAEYIGRERAMEIADILGVDLVDLDF